MTQGLRIAGELSSPNEIEAVESLGVVSQFNTVPLRGVIASQVRYLVY
eukprot:CAMPEP_0172526886 /NCGR_PEP_ID=MMETSP1067-20121228/1710_1 /TAXON_ID=265564 ORGANISM="Thalassiosira punctigera, Strain Tpunct2005C2" /NCGR_SAMPLE_ID=MMETSP1067 /ASSEMBLY_ACC=CAM_ASM_000444 /LENGTH=47 /DNA_ID= /DNA_START= /DNA_END= /DNA_ORIENTATION=